MPTVEIYTVRFCPYCNAAKALLKRRGIPYKELDIAGNWERRDEMLRRAHGQITVPQLFCGDIHIGSHRDLEALDKSGEFKKMIASQV